MQLYRLLLLFSALPLLSACDESNTSAEDAVQTGGVAVFDPPAAQAGDTSALPFPFNASLTDPDGTISVPSTSSAAALGAIDGFSTVAPLTAKFDNSLDADSLVGGKTVRVFEVTTDPSTRLVTGVVNELSAGSDYSVGPSPAIPDNPADPDDSLLMITLLRPLKPRTSYLVALLDGIKFTNRTKAVSDGIYILTKSGSPLVDATGESQTALLSDAQAAQLEPLRLLVNSQEAALAGIGIDGNDIILSWSFTTQSTVEVLEATRQFILAQPIATAVLGDSGTDSPLGAADILIGKLQSVPYFLTPAANPSDTTILTNFWTAANPDPVLGERNLTAFNPLPQKVSDETIPLMVSVPKGPKPAGGWPTVIYYHGLLSNRTTLIPLADTLAGAGFAGVAIDIPLHGVTGLETNGTENFFAPSLPPPLNTNERHFSVDLITGNTPGTPPDGVIDPTGVHAINLASLLTTRDNLRQGIVDLFTLTRALQLMDFDNDSQPDVDTTQVRLLAFSTGGFAGTPFLALEPSVGSAVLAVTGGGLGKFFDGSINFGPQLTFALASQGVNKGFQAYEDFVRLFQTVIDSGDPVNFASDAAAGRGILMFEVVGGNTSPPDQTTPNDVLNQRPGTVIANTIPGIGGSTPLANALGLTQVSATTSGSNLKGIVRYTAGGHSSLLSPLDLQGNPDPTFAAVTAEMQSQAATFLATNGETVQVGDSTLVLQETRDAQRMVARTGR